MDQRLAELELGARAGGVAVGGLGRVTGVFYAALIIGVLDFVLKQYVPRGGTLYIYALTILLLLIRPQGLFGKSA